MRMRNAGLGATGGSDGRRAAEWPRGCAGAVGATRRPRGGVWGDGTEGTEGRMPAEEELGTYVSERRTALPECPRYACVRSVGGVSSRAEKEGREGEREKRKERDARWRLSWLYARCGSCTVSRQRSVGARRRRQSRLRGWGRVWGRRWTWTWGSACRGEARRGSGEWEGLEGAGSVGGGGEEEEEGGRRPKGVRWAEVEAGFRLFDRSPRAGTRRGGSSHHFLMRLPVQLPVAARPLPSSAPLGPQWPQCRPRRQPA